MHGVKVSALKSSELKIFRFINRILDSISTGVSKNFAGFDLLCDKRYWQCKELTKLLENPNRGTHVMTTSKDYLGCFWGQYVNDVKSLLEKQTKYGK